MTREEMKNLLIQAWKDVFEVEEVPDDADFFEEGGDSIKAVQLSSWLVQKGIKLDLGKIFYTPLLSEMADALEESDPMYVPDQLLTKDLLKEKYTQIMNGETPGAGNTASAGAADTAAGQICDPADNPVPEGPICDPEKAPETDEPICDPALSPAMGGPICDPAAPLTMDGPVCDPAAPFMMNGPICDPALNPMLNHQTVHPSGRQLTGAFAGKRPFSQGSMAFHHQQAVSPAGNAADPSTTMQIMHILQLMLSQQQSLMEMMQLVLKMNMPAASARPLFNPAGMGKPPFMPPLSDEKMAELQKTVASYQSRKLSSPVEKPNVIGLKKAKVEKPRKSAQEVLEYVLSTVLKDPLDKSKDLFEQGLTSLDTVKIVTRCGEYGYTIKMQDIYMHSEFYELVKCMVPGEG